MEEIRYSKWEQNRNFILKRQNTLSKGKGSEQIKGSRMKKEGITFSFYMKRTSDDHSQTRWRFCTGQKVGLEGLQYLKGRAHVWGFWE